MKNKNIIKLLLVLMVGVFFVSCDEGGDPDPGSTKVEDMAGDWFVQLTIDGEDVYNVGYYQLSTYNTASDNGTEMWIDDHELWPMKVTTPVNTGSLTFSGTTLDNEYSYTSGGESVSPTATITNGVIVPDGATTTGGNTSDSISFDVEFSDDPGTVYTIVGYKRTGFLEDEH